MGFFTDAYDLFIIGAILDIFARYKIPGFELNNVVAGLLTSSALITAILGQLVFGFLADRLGRKAIYGVEALLLTLGAFLSALSPNIYWLIAFRSLMGFGIGGDYPVSATIMSEYANVKDRGKLVALVFANQGLGSLVAVAVGAISAYSLPPDIAWRVMAAVGAIPAATVIYLRRKVPETPRYAALVKGNLEEAKRAASFLGTNLDADKKVVSKDLTVGEFLRKYGLVLIGTALPWFILDIAFYGTGIYSGPIVTSILGKPSSVGFEIVEQGVPFMVGFFGYFTAVALMDKLGRKLIQIQGFVAMAVIYAIVSAVMITSGKKVEGFLIPTSIAFAVYSLSFFFIDFGPNTTTFVLPAELYPTKYRTTGHGISAASGKLGAAITTYLFPTLLSTYGIKPILEALILLSLIGALITAFFVKEPKLKSLEEVSEEEVEAKTTT
ncbi:MAG: general substrate transporter [Candidatus Aramenus sulfurataquae]|uniref:General substrate transporter n=1 Tax=Candidatus Aramenus sulfurataquae TaxID=1326980 RepID=W7KVK8_9CREN|nr:MAG: general substrate transporter [Candidatus Aramenus sulfurataquae]